MRSVLGARYFTKKCMPIVYSDRQWARDGEGDIFQRGERNQVGFMCTFAQSAKPVKPRGTKALAAEVRVLCSGPK